jgi:hypothetical protein
MSSNCTAKHHPGSCFYYPHGCSAFRELLQEQNDIRWQQLLAAMTIKHAPPMAWDKGAHSHWPILVHRDDRGYLDRTLQGLGTAKQPHSRKRQVWPRHCKASKSNHTNKKCPHPTRWGPHPSPVLHVDAKKKLSLITTSHLVGWTTCSTGSTHGNLPFSVPNLHTFLHQTQWTNTLVT